MTKRAPLVGLYPGTFDPITLGHMDIIHRATKVVDRLIIAVASNAGKGPLFSTDERVEMVRDEVAVLDTNGMPTIEVMPFDNLLMHLAEVIGARVIIRGLTGRVRLRIRVPDGVHERPLEPRRRDGLPDRLGAPAVHCLAFRQGDRGRLGGDITSFVSPRVAIRPDRALRRAA